MEFLIRSAYLIGYSLLFVLAASRLGAAERTQDFSRDPGWIGSRNRLVESSPASVRQDFGWSPTMRAGGSAPGEIGGRIYRSVRPAYYAKRLKPLTMDDALSCSGTLAVTHWDYVYGWQTGSTVFAGFFNSREQGWRPPSFMGFRVEAINDKYAVDEKLTWEMIGLDPKNPPQRSPRPSNPLVYVVNPVMLEFTYGTAGWAAGALTPPGEIHADGRPHTWRMDYDPKGGEGHGSITTSWDGGKPVTANISKSHRRQGATFDRFGVFNYQQPGGRMDFWIDDPTINGEHEDFTRNPRWEGKGNRTRFDDRVQYGMQDFGYSAKTNHAGSGRGELGGRFWRVDASESEYQGNYGDDIGHLTMNDRLSVRGKICVPRFSIDSGMHFGWYNSKRQGWPPENFVGAYYDSLTDTGRIIMPMYGTSKAGISQGRDKFSGAAIGDWLLLLPDRRPHDFSIVYDPEGNGGGGSVTLTIDNKSQRLDLAPGAKAEGADLDRFGVFSMQDNNGKDCQVFLDDLTYTVGEDAPPVSE